MDERLKFYLLLNSANLSFDTAQKFFETGASPRELWDNSSLKLFGNVFSPKAMARISKNADEGWAEKEYEKCANAGISIISYENEDYPDSLKDLPAPPVILYCKGDVKAISDENKKVSVVGTRKMTAYGKRAAEAIGKMCAAYGITLISGGAAGIDTTAQKACLENGGTVVAILGTGLDKAYPASNREFFKKISEQGLLVSEFPLGMNAEAWHFPHRNRIVSALSAKTIVVEAPFKSGSMITARISLELGREIWAVPGSIFEENSEGTNRLIFDGAYIYTDCDTFLASYGISKRKEAKTKVEIEMSPDESIIYDYLLKNSNSTADAVGLAVKMSIPDIMGILSVMLAKKIIRMSGPGRYSLM